MLMNRKERVSIEKWSNKLGATTNGNFAKKKCATKVILTQDECRHVLMLTLFQTIQGLFLGAKKVWNAVRAKKRLAICSTCLRLHNRVILIIILFNIFFQHSKSMKSGDRRDSSSTLHEWKIFVIDLHLSGPQAIALNKINDFLLNCVLNLSSEQSNFHFVSQTICHRRFFYCFVTWKVFWTIRIVEYIEEAVENQRNSTKNRSFY